MRVLTLWGWLALAILVIVGVPFLVVFLPLVWAFWAGTVKGTAHGLSQWSAQTCVGGLVLLAIAGVVAARIRFGPRRQGK